jgi:hypothetical protein
VATIRIRLSVEFTVSGLAATVYDGLLVALHGGACKVTGTLLLEGRQLVERTVETAPTAIVRLPGNGFPLLSGDRRAVPGIAEAPASR